MNMSIQIKFLIVCSVLVLVTITGLSGTYYLLINWITHQESRQRIQIGFDIVLDDITNQIRFSTDRVDEFLKRDTYLHWITYVRTIGKAELNSAKFIVTSVSQVTEALKSFGPIVSADRLALYGVDKRLLAVYHQQADQPTVGAYVISGTGRDTYLPMDDLTQVSEMNFKGLPIPDASLPTHLAALYEGDIPETLSATLFTEEQKLGLKIVVPLYHNKDKTGIFVSEVFFTQNTVARSASLSRTAVNLFAGTQWSVGTLPAQSQLEQTAMAHLASCETILRQNTGIEPLAISLNHQDYLQGQCAFKNPQGENIGAITVSLLQDVEKQGIRRMQIAGLVISVIMLGLTFGISLFLSRHPARSVQHLVSVIGSLAEGDLSKTATAVSQDEFGILTVNINQMIERLRAIVGQVQRSGIQVTSSATELAATAKQQEVTMVNQVESANKVLKSVQEISDVITKLVQTMQEVAAMSQESVGFASSGQQDLGRMQEAMTHMEEASRTISGRLQTIHEKADNITGVVTTITKVADQTNLLSLNAAIEAEKAGEYGRGFTVVAREIRRLADQTAVATLDIEQMVKEMQSAVSAGVMEIDKFIQDVQHSAEDVERISSQLNRIIEQVQALSPRFEEVNLAMGHQSDSAHEINTAMLNLSDEMRQTTESLKESFLAIAQLNDAARGLQEEMSRFKVN
jgi:methyl-accepting chemotaxis protein